MLSTKHLKLLTFVGTRNASQITGPAEVPPRFQNRNPRNLERMRLALKPQGYHLDGFDISWWHKLEVYESGQHATALVVHYINGPVIKASTQEWAIKKQLYRGTDTSAFINLGRVLARRCLEAGITEMHCNIKSIPGRKIEKFLDCIKDGGIQLEEPPAYKHPYPWDLYRPEKPWTVLEESEHQKK